MARLKTKCLTCSIYVEMNDDTTKLPENMPAEDGGELMAEEPEDVELERMFSADV